MNCGDVVHRSTLDPVLRMEQKGLNPQGLALLALAIAYLTATPGVLMGAIDYYILDKIQRLTNVKVYTKDDIKLGRKLAVGGFGTVYRGDLYSDDKGSPKEVIVKKAKEFGAAEVWMNERLMRAAPGCFADFITAFEEGDGKPDDPLWLIWQYEGDYTLYDLMQKKEWPYNLEPLLFGRELNLPKGPRRKAVSMQLVMQQLLTALAACHRTGIVHRDIKPQNVIISARDQKVKLIDLGAAADLRIGINYVPNEFLLDPRYAPPQQYIMSTQTPEAPPLPVAALLSPILWRLNNPDRFDMYSTGVMLMQMLFPALRSDNNLIAFNRKLESFDYDLDAWRAFQEKRGAKDFLESFAMVDLDDGAAWDLLRQLVVYVPKKRLSARAALRHRWFGGGLLGKLTIALARVGDVADQVVGNDSWLEGAMSKTGTRAVGGLSEAQLADELQGVFQTMPRGLRNASATVAWWRQRQVAFKRQLVDKARKGVGRNLGQLGQSAGKTIRESKKVVEKRIKLPGWLRSTTS
ncbi:hypothetical protein WJX72_003731 [[Myrmecia] bisecta]|uniref:Protein kinase domain-containing protein n=1 Tax=[Myrmecia] bisecta TaxID=41462 RepID=A0AAW1Q8M7_9CHLO